MPADHMVKPAGFANFLIYSHGKDKSHLRFLCTVSASPISSLSKNERFYRLFWFEGAGEQYWHSISRTRCLPTVWWFPPHFFFNCVLPIPAAIGIMNVLARSPLNLNSVKWWNLPSKWYPGLKKRPIFLRRPRFVLACNTPFFVRSNLISRSGKLLECGYLAIPDLGGSCAYRHLEEYTPPTPLPPCEHIRRGRGCVNFNSIFIVSNCICRLSVFG